MAIPNAARLTDDIRRFGSFRKALGGRAALDAGERARRDELLERIRDEDRYAARVLEVWLRTGPASRLVAADTGDVTLWRTEEDAVEDRCPVGCWLVSAPARDALRAIGASRPGAPREVAGH